MEENRAGWFQDARYGIFVHWGLYSILGGCLNGERISCIRYAEWIMQEAKIPVKEYKKLLDEFNPVDFNAEDWVKRIKSYGGKYLCFTAKHHEGFALWDSKVSDFTVMHTPFKRDVVKELAEACKKHGIKLCLYYSQMQDWEDPDGDGNTWDYKVEDKDFEAYFRRKVLPQVRELLTNYGEIGVMWFDTPYNMPKEFCEELAGLVHTLQPGCLINSRIGYGLGEIKEMCDNNIPRFAVRETWQVPMTLNDTWGYASYDHKWKSANQVLHMLVDVNSKGGNLLLNIGPDSLGRFPEEADNILNQVGAFLEKNGESIYGTKGMPDAPFLYPWGECTCRNHRIYMHVLEYPVYPYEIKIYNMKSKVKKVWLLESGQELKFIQKYEIGRDEYRFRTYLPEHLSGRLDTVVVVDIEEELAEFHYQPEQW